MSAVRCRYVPDRWLNVKFDSTSAYFGTVQIAELVNVFPATSVALANIVYVRPLLAGDRSARS